MDSLSLAIKAFPCRATVKSRMSLTQRIESLDLGMMIAPREAEGRELSKTSKLQHFSII